MNRWIGKTVVVTGASVGIGASICVALANEGLTVVGFARRPELVDDLRSQVAGKGTITSRLCDVSKPDDLTEAFLWVDSKFGGTDILVNNAGVMYPGHITELGDSPLSDDQITSIVDINLKAVMLSARHAVASMKRRKFDGHVIIINSIAGHYIPFAPDFNAYPSSKHGVTAFSAMLKHELAMLKSGIRVTSISPGLVDTDMTVAAKGFVDFAPLQPRDVADAVIYVISTPPSVNISELTIQSVLEKKL